MKKVYFSASISGGRDNLEQCTLLVDYLKKHFTVLTEHIVHKVIQDTLSESNSEFVYTRDVNYLKESDFIVAECSTPSLGVGYELAYGENINKPIYILFNSNSSKPLSKMIKGNPSFKVFIYSNKDELVKIIEEICENEAN